MHVGGVVSARSVKLLDRIHNPGMFLKNLISVFPLFKLLLLKLVFIMFLKPDLSEKRSKKKVKFTIS